MTQVTMRKIQEVTNPVHYSPAISIFLPFDTADNSRKAIKYYLDYALTEVQSELKNYPAEINALLMQKLNSIIRNINFNSNKKSIAVYVSPVFEKVLYLDISIEQKVVFDESFDIRDLVQSKKEFHNYLLLFISGTESKIFLGNSFDLTMIVSNAQGSYSAGEVTDKINHVPFSKSPEILEHHFMQHMDDTIDILLNAYQLPLFVCGIAEAITHFNALTKHTSSIMEYLTITDSDISSGDLKPTIKNIMNNWDSVKHKKLAAQLRLASGSKKIASGFKNVWKAAMDRRGHLLLVGKDFVYSSADKVKLDNTVPTSGTYYGFSCVNNEVDDIIEKVLENGGDVEFVPDEILKDYDYIALI